MFFRPKMHGSAPLA